LGIKTKNDKRKEVKKMAVGPREAKKEEKRRAEQEAEILEKIIDLILRIKKSRGLEPRLFLFNFKFKNLVFFITANKLKNSLVVNFHRIFKKILKRKIKV